MEEHLRAWAKARGLEISWGPIGLVEKVWNDLDARRQAGELDPEFDRERMSWFRYPEGLPLEWATSVIMIALSRPAHTVTFTLDDGPLETSVPPTYIDFGAIREEMRWDLASCVLKGQHQLEILQAPLKAVAARLGLVRYGINNITYTVRFGSYIQLIGFLTDALLAPASASESASPEVLSKCQSCAACRRVCPTGAIGGDRFLLRAERCLTLHNEFTGEWPEYIAESAHHCLVGCMRCQEFCPANDGLLRTESSGLVFSADETRAILCDKVSAENSQSAALADKLATVGLADYAPMLGRNLRALVRQRT